MNNNRRPQNHRPTDPRRPAPTLNSSNQRRRKHRKHRKVSKKLLRYLKDNLPVTITIALCIVVIIVASVSSALISDDTDSYIAVESPDDQKDKNESDIDRTDIFTITPSETEGVPSPPCCDVLDKDGNVILDVTFDKSGEPFRLRRIIYNEDKTVNFEYEYNADSLLLTKTVYPTADDTQYSSYSKVTLTVEYNQNGKYNGFVSSCYDANGKRVKDIHYSSGGVLKKYTLIEYNLSGNVSKESNFSSYDRLSTYTEYKYTDGGLLQSKTQCDETGSVGIKDLFYYDEHGRISREETYIQKTLHSFTDYLYSADGTNRVKTVSTLVNEAEMIYEKEETVEEY